MEWGRRRVPPSACIGRRSPVVESLHRGPPSPPPPPHPPLVYPAAVDRPGRRVTNGRGARAGGRTRIGVGAGQVRCKDLKAARGVYGRAIGVAPKERVFKSYIELELQMGNIDRVSV